MTVVATPDVIKPMLTAADIESALRPLLDEQATTLAALLSDALAGAQTPEQIQARLASAPDLKASLRALAGQRVVSGQAVVNFGSGNQFGDILIGDVAGGDLIKISLVVTPPPAVLHQLRAPVGDFTGRKAELRQLVQSLACGSAAIIGLRGMGGIGKTELAYAAAAHLSEQFPDAQLLVELRGASASPLTPEQALQNLIRSFEREVKLPGDLAQLQGIFRSVLNGRRVLILADDARDAAQVRPLLPPAGCALLITSRQHFTLPGMAAITLGTLSPAEAEALLLTICPRIGEDAPALARLCGYLPLALRVSASLLAMSTRRVETYLKELAQRRLELLADPDNPADPEASVEASLRLSYEALEQAVQAALCQLSVFPTSFDLAAAQAVLAREEAEALLDQLCRRSLLEFGPALARYSQHDLLRAFGAARLEDAEVVRLRHARHYAQVAARAENELYLKSQALTGLTLFDLERVQIDAGWTWALARAGEHDADELLLDYAATTANISLLRYHQRHEHIPRLEAALGAAQRREESAAWLRTNLGSAYVALGDARRAIDFFLQSLVTARELGDRSGEGATLGNLGSAYFTLGNLEQATDFYQQHLNVARELGDRRGEGNALSGLGNAYVARRDAHSAIDFFQQSLALLRELGDRYGEGTILGNLGNAYFILGDLEQATDFYQQHLNVARELGDRRGEGNALSGLGNAYFARGDARPAIDFFQQSLDLFRERGDRYGEGTVLGNLGVAYGALGNLEQATDFYQQHLNVARELGDRRGAANALGNLGTAYAARGDAHSAIDFFQQSLALLHELGDRYGEGTVLGNIGVIYADLGELEQAIDFYQQCIAILDQIGDRAGAARNRWNLGLLVERQGDLARAAELMQAFVDFECEIGHVDAKKDVARLERLRQRIAGERPLRKSFWRRIFGR